MKKLLIILIILFTSFVCNGQDWVNVTPNQVANGWSAAYNTNNQLIIYYQIWRTINIQYDNRFHYYIYFYSGHSTNPVMLTDVSFYSDGYYVGELKNILIPLETLHVYTIYSSNARAGIGFTWKNSIIY